MAYFDLCNGHFKYMFSFNKKYYSQRKKKQNIISNNDSTQVILTNGYISIQTTQLYDFCWKRFHRTVFKTGKVLKGARLPWTNSWETSSLWFPHPVSPSPLCSACLCTACSKTYKLAEKFPLSFFWFIALIALVLGAPGRLFGRFWKCDLQKQEKLLSTVFWEVWKLWRHISVKTWGLQNRSEPFWRSAEPFWTVLETFAPRKLARKFVLCAKNPGSRKARTRLNHSGCSCPSLKVTHHHPQEPDR